MVGDEPGGSIWLRVGMLAKTKLWHRMPRRIKSEFQRSGRKPFYSGLLVDLDVVEDKRRDRWTVFELRTEAVKALQALKVIGGTRHAPSRACKLLDHSRWKRLQPDSLRPRRPNASADRSSSVKAKHNFDETCWPLTPGNVPSPAALSPTSSKQPTSWASEAEVRTRSPMVSCFGPTGTRCSIWASARFTQDG